jgi:His/Glu/Gln/Arg/opine family amino acid ABC transporter permease subunit
VLPSETGDTERPFAATKAFLRKLAFAAVGVGAGIAILYAAGVAGLYDLRYALSLLPPNRPALLTGLLATLGLTAVVIPLGFGLGFLFGWARTQRSWLVRAIATTYVEFFRGMPPIVLIAFAFLISITLLGNNPRIGDAFSFAVGVSLVALAAHSGAYQAEIIRAGILSVPVGQVEAGEAIGMTKGTILTRITLPQMFRISLPALGNEFASVIKDNSLLSVVGALELTFQGKNLEAVLATGGGNVDLVLIIWVEIALLYFAITFVFSRTLQAIEKRFRVPGLEAAQL